MAANEGWKGRIIASHNDGTCQFDDQQCSAGSQCQGEQHARRDRVHAAGNGEEPAVQFGTCLLIGCNNTPGADAISTTATTKKRPANAATTRKMITRTR